MPAQRWVYSKETRMTKLTKKKIVVKAKTVKKKPVKKLVKKPTVKKVKPVKKSIKKKPAIVRKIKKIAKAEQGYLGEITHYFAKVKAAVIKLTAPLTVGDKINIKGHTTDLTQTVSSLQIDRVVINSARKGDEIGLMVESRVRCGDKVTKI